MAPIFSLFLGIVRLMVRYGVRLFVGIGVLYLLSVVLIGSGLYYFGKNADEPGTAANGLKTALDDYRDSREPMLSRGQSAQQFSTRTESMQLGWSSSAASRQRSTQPGIREAVYEDDFSGGYAGE